MMPSDNIIMPHISLHTVRQTTSAATPQLHFCIPAVAVELRGRRDEEEWKDVNGGVLGVSLEGWGAWEVGCVSALV